VKNPFFGYLDLSVESSDRPWPGLGSDGGLPAWITKRPIFGQGVDSGSASRLKAPGKTTYDSQAFTTRRYE
jgi:hypothetical protein